LKFNDLTKAQKTYILATISEYPSLKDKEFVSVSEIKQMFEEMKAKRKVGGVKVGYPIWLVTQNRVGRSQYKFPLPTDLELNSFSFEKSKPSKESVVIEHVINQQIDYTEEEFLEELRANGIRV
jgi:hypothetical protein